MFGKFKIVWLIPIIWAGTAFGAFAESKAEGPLVISMDTGYAPMTFINAAGEPAGLFVDIWRLWSEKSGRKIEFRGGNWDESIRSIENGTADIHSGLFASEDRAKWMVFSQPFYRAASYFFYPAGRDEGSAQKGLEGWKIGATKGSFQEAYLRKNYPKAQIVSFASREKMIRALLEGSIHAFLAEHHPVAASVTVLGLTGKIRQGDKVVFTKKFHAGALARNADLLAVVDKGFDLVSERELSAIERQWVPNPDARYFDVRKPGIRLTSEQERWLEDHPVVRLGLYEGIAPAMFVGEDGKFQGIVKELAEIIADRAGVRFEIVPISPSMRKDVPAYVKDGKIDVFPCFDSPERRRYLNCTAPFYTVGWVIVARDDVPFLRGLHDLEALNLKVAVVGKIQWETILARDCPGIETVKADTGLEALRLVSGGRADAVVIGLDVSGYLIRKHGLHNLKVAASAGYPDSRTRFGVRKDIPELAQILDKAISSIDRRKMDQVIQKWLPVRYEQGVDIGYVRKAVLIIVGVFVLLLVVSLFWNRRLSREVKERKRAEGSLKESEQRLKQSQQLAHVGYWDWYMEDSRLEWSDETYRIFGRDKEPFEVTVESFEATIHPEDTENFFREREDALAQRRDVDIEHRIVLPDGAVRHVHEIARILRDERGNIFRVMGTVQDITARKLAESKLQEYSQHLEEMVAERTRELEKAQTELLVKERLAVLGHFSGSISHELHNPLAAIDASAYYLNMVLNGGEEKAIEHIARIRNNVKKSTDIIQSLLSLSRMEKPKTVSNNVRKLVQKAIANSRIPDSVVVKLDMPEKDVFIDADAEQVRMALKNIVRNAVQAMDEKGTLTVTVRQQDGASEISISDTGPGICREHIEKIFDPLFTTKTHGIGFGLSIAKMIVENHGWTIRAESPPHSGARFVIAIESIAQRT